MDAAERSRERRDERVEQRPSFSVVTGGGLDARARAGVSPQFLSRVRTVVICALVFIALGACRVALSTATVSTLQANSALRSQIKEAQTLNEDLQVEKSVLSSSSRISRIATQNYGMSLSTNREVLDLSSAGTSADATSTDAVSATTANGDAAQSVTNTDTASPEA
ncbi:cell division protein FtsL [Olsenella sp. kh2p3]|jgi:cell division protein FtsL|nr:cell division protein FtsL [Olsenella sp. kh2p3]